MAKKACARRQHRLASIVSCRRLADFATDDRIRAKQARQTPLGMRLLWTTRTSAGGPRVHACFRPGKRASARARRVLARIVCAAKAVISLHWSSGPLGAGPRSLRARCKAGRSDTTRRTSSLTCRGIRVAASDARAALPRCRVAVLPEHPNTSPPEPSGPRYSARVALSCEHGQAPGQVLHTLQGLRSVIDDRLSGDLGGRYDRHSAQSVGTDKLTVTFILRASTHADAIRSAGLAAATLAELLIDHAAGVDLSGVALVVRAQ